MYQIKTGHRFIPNFLVEVPLYRRAQHEIKEAVIKYVFHKLGSHDI